MGLTFSVNHFVNSESNVLYQFATQIHSPICQREQNDNIYFIWNWAYGQYFYL